MPELSSVLVPRFDPLDGLIFSTTDTLQATPDLRRTTKGGSFSISTKTCQLARSIAANVLMILKNTQGGPLAASGPHRVGGVNRYIIDKRSPDRCKTFISCVESFVSEDSKTMLWWNQLKYDLVISRPAKGNSKSITTVDRDILDVILWPCDASWPSAWGEVVYRASGSVGLCEPDKFLYDCEGFRGTVWESAVDELACV